MTMHEHDFDRQMRDKFDSYRPDASPGLWDKIVARLDEQAGTEKPVATMPPSRKLHGGWWKSAAAILLLGILAWWLYRPAEVVYLQSRAPRLAQDVTEETPKATAPVAPVQSEVASEPLNLTPIRALFAKRARREPSREALGQGLAEPLQGEELVAVAPDSPSDMQTASATEPVIADQPTTPSEADTQLPIVESQLREDNANVAELPVVLADLGAETVAEPPVEKAFGVSSILNIVVGSVDPRDEKLVTFSDDEEGLIKMAFNLGRGKSRRGSE